MPRARQLGVAFGERRRVQRQAPGDAHQRVAVLGQALAGDPAAAADGRGLVHRRRQAGGGVEVLGVGEPGDRQAVRGERGSPDRRRPGQAGQDLPVGARPAGPRSRPRARRCRPAASGSGPGRGPAAAARARRPAAAAGSPATGRPSTRRSALVSLPGARAISDRATAHGPRTPPRRPAPPARSGDSIGSDRAVPGRRGQARAQGVELVVEPLLGLLAVGDQPAAVPHRGAQLLDRRLLGPAADPRPAGPDRSARRSRGHRS